jgi:hypothetical protein
LVGPRPGKGGLALGSCPYFSLAPYETLRRTSISAPTPEAISTRLATKVTGPASGGPPVLGNGAAVAVAVDVAVAVAVAVGVAVAIAVGVAVAIAVGVAVAVAAGVAMPPPYDCAMATDAKSKTITATTANTSKILFIKHSLHELGALTLGDHPPSPTRHCGRVVSLESTPSRLALFTQVPGETVRKAPDAPTAQPCGPPRRGFSLHCYPITLRS